MTEAEYKSWLNSQNTSHTLPWWTSYDMYFGGNSPCYNGTTFYPSQPIPQSSKETGSAALPICPNGHGSMENVANMRGLYFRNRYIYIIKIYKISKMRQTIIKVVYYILPNFNSLCAEVRLYAEYEFKNMAANAWTHCVVRSLAVMVLAM